jgi:O-antigen ligase
MYQQRLAIHSTYLNALTESGIVGLFFLILMLLAILVDFIKSLKLTNKHSDEKLKNYTIAFFILYILFLVYGIFSASLINRTTVFIMASGFILYELNLEAIDNKLNKKSSENYRDYL